MLLLGSNLVLSSQQVVAETLTCERGLDAFVESRRAQLANRGALGFGYEAAEDNSPNLPARRLVVVAVIPKSSADVAGIRLGDVISEVDHKPLPPFEPDGDAVAEGLFSQILPGAKVSLTVMREGKEVKVLVQAAAPTEPQIQAWLRASVYRVCGKALFQEYARQTGRQTKQTVGVPHPQEH